MKKEVVLEKKSTSLLLLFSFFIEWPNVWWAKASLIEFLAAVLYKGHMGVKGYQTNSRLFSQSFHFRLGWSYIE